MTSSVGIGRLLAAGLLLEAPGSAGGMGIKIQPAAGERREKAVLRVIKSLKQEEASALKSHVDWIQDYGFDDPAHDAPRGAERTASDALSQLKHALSNPVATAVQVAGPAVPSPAPRPALDDDPFIPYEVDDDEEAALQALSSVGVVEEPAPESAGRERLRG